MRAITLAIVLSVCATAANAESFSFPEKPGPFAVGFKVVEQYDTTRTYLGRFDTVTGEPIARNRARPIQTLIWYPAQQSASPMKYGDYLRLSGSEDDFTRSAEQIDAVANFRLQDFIPADMPASTVESIKQQTMWATRDATAVDQKFPVVIYAPSHNESAAENADLCEYLASHGYVVIASPSFGSDNRWLELQLADAETEAADIRFLVGYASTLADADARHIAVIGYSWGGVADVFAAARDSRITALIGFDGGIRLVGKIVAEAKDVTPEKIAIPYLYLSSRAESIEELFREKQDLSDDLLARLKYADLFVVTFDPVVHFQFASKHLRFLDTKDRIMFPGDYSLAETYRAHGWIARYTLAFLDAESKNDTEAANWLTRSPETNGFPPHQIKLEVNRGSGIAPTREAIAAELHRRGFSHAPDVFAELHKQDANFKLEPAVFVDWIEELNLRRRYADSANIAQEFSNAYPERSGPLVRLGDAYRLQGDKKRAIEAYKKALALDHDNPFALKGMKEVGGSP